MKIHEYQARQILKNFDVPVPVAEVASSPEEARKIAEEIGGKVWAVKSQIHAGGRGKGGGVKLARSLEDVSNLSRLMIGSRLVTKQTGPAGALSVRSLFSRVSISSRSSMSVFSSTASFRGRYSLLLLKAAWKLKKLPLNSLKNH